MAELTKEINAPAGEAGYYEDEFGLSLKIYLGARFIFYVIGIFMILGALVCLGTGVTYFDELVSTATGYSATNVDANFYGYQICMFVQTAYTILSAAAVALLYIKRSKLFAFIDLGLFVVLMGVMFAMGAADLLTNGSVWAVYLVLNPVISFIALFAGKHFKYMPFI
ncbi:MAG: hypothetical protein ACI4J4_05940 [Ruminiclostridium sp.]